MAVVTTQQSVAALYTAIFNRAPDQAGLNFWTAQINGGASFATIAEGFAQHEVFTTGIGALPNADYVNALYTNILGSAGDAAGIAYWTARLAAGESKASVVASFVEGSLTIDLPALLAAGSLTQADYDLALVRQQTLTNKADVGIYFANTLGAASNLNPATVSTSKAGLEADPIYKASQAAIAGVDSTAASVKTAQDAIAVAAGSPNPGQALLGQTFTLTTGADTFVGGASGDVFNALSVKADGVDAITLSAFDSIDGGAGKDTLNIYSNGVVNVGLNGATVKNVETINFNNTGAGFGNIDASKFVGATAINQVNIANAVTGLAVGTTAGFTNIDATGALDVTAATAAASVTVSLTNVDESASLAVAGAALNTVNVSGTRVDGNDVGTTVSALDLTVTAGVDQQTISVNSAVDVVLTVDDTASAITKKVTTVDASASTGVVGFTGDADTATIKTGVGADVVSLKTTTVAAAAGVTAVDALVSTGAGNDRITVLTTGNGATTVDAGAGDDVVAITTRGTGKLSVNLGDGNDTFTSAQPINGTDVIDAGAGTDTLALSLVGAANIGAFSNFDAFDVAGLAKTLDVDILAAKNTVSEFIGTATSGNATLTNIGAGVNFRATGDMGTVNTLSLTQKTAGALTVTLDADETGVADTTIDTASAKIIATNATSLKAVFDTAYLASITGETALGDNVSTLQLQGVASTLNVVSGGANANNVLTYDDNATTDALTSITVSGDRALNLSVTTATKLATVDASAQTGGLTFSLANLKDGGNVVLGSGKDVITVTSASTTGGVETITGFEKTAAVAFSIVAADATAKAAAIADADVLVLTGASVAADAAGSIANGVLTFTGAGPADLNAAINAADTAVGTTVGTAVAFEYLDNSYAFVQGGATDTVVQLTGVTDLTHFAAAGASQFLVA